MLAFLCIFVLSSKKNKTICLRESMKRCIFAFEKREIWLTKEFTCAWLT